eukprot:309113-Chlamydomonas_euryale.AAC.3
MNTWWDKGCGKKDNKQDHEASMMKVNGHRPVLCQCCSAPALLSRLCSCQRGGAAAKHCKAHVAQGKKSAGILDASSCVPGEDNATRHRKSHP